MTIELCSAVSPTRQEQRSFLRLTLPTQPPKTSNLFPSPPLRPLAAFPSLALEVNCFSCTVAVAVGHSQCECSGQTRRHMTQARRYSYPLLYSPRLLFCTCNAKGLLSDFPWSVSHRLGSILPERFPLCDLTLRRKRPPAFRSTLCTGKQQGSRDSQDHLLTSVALVTSSSSLVVTSAPRPPGSSFVFTGKIHFLVNMGVQIPQNSQRHHRFAYMLRPD